MNADHPAGQEPTTPAHPLNFRDMRFPLVLVRCLGCRKPAGTWHESLNGDGHWENGSEKRCRCQPPVEYPAGEELQKLLHIALQKPRHPRGGARHTVFL